jgi:hypothetical protein
MRRPPLLLLLIVTACHRQAAPPAARHKRTEASAPAPSAPAAQETGQSSPAEDGAGAADVLRRYYALIEAGNYGDAWTMRSGGRGIDEAQFAAHFKAYESYHSQVGAPSQPVASQGWIWVEVPVMTTGRFLGGKPFGSAGSVTLRRPAPGTAAPEGGWRIYTG